MHAVAGLLKLYLRELPTNILTTERREDFVKVTEMDDNSKKITALNELVHTLPIENFELLRALSGHLIHIVENSNINKMTIRNVGIVFSPTLNIPAQVFSMFLHEYNHIFVRPDEGNLDALRTHVSAEYRPSTSASRGGLDPPKTPKTPGLPLSPLPPPSTPLPPPSTPKPQVVSYEPTYETVVTPTPGMLKSPMTFPQPPASSSKDHSPAMLDVKTSKARRRESSMMFMMGARKSKNAFSSRHNATEGMFFSLLVAPIPEVFFFTDFAAATMVMEDSVYE